MTSDSNDLKSLDGMIRKWNLWYEEAKENESKFKIIINDFEGIEKYEQYI
ncbi:hypothetical protein ACOSZA_07705 [Mammaliicoccus sciuri]